MKKEKPRRFRPRSDESRVKTFITALKAYRTAKKQVEFLSSWLKALNPCTNRLHPSLRQLNPQAVGRFSASKPNLQQAPHSRDMRGLFKAPDGYKLVIGDYSAVEMRIMAKLSGDQELIAAFNQGICPHRKTAAFINNKTIEQIEPKGAERQAAKAVNFGLIYGMSASTLQSYAEASYGVQMTTEEAMKAHKKFFELYSGIRTWQENQSLLRFSDHYKLHYSHNQENGFSSERRPSVRTLAGRLRVWPSEEKISAAGNPYKAKVGPVTELYNTPDQGTGADVLKLAMGILYRSLIKRGWDDVHLIASAHDELILEVPQHLESEATELLKRVMEMAGQKYLQKVLLEAEVVTGDSWADKH